mmetsp:Transcript_18479/g.36238  ORF Transcript_18479/g.36238 Transcript_18479/m.36238 type:complete len:276 (+) Transcript_18479:42-869(+)
MCQPWKRVPSPQHLWGESLRPEGEDVGWLHAISSPPSSPQVSPETVRRQKHAPSQLQPAPWPLSPRQKLAKNLIASALVPVGSSGRQWLPSASSALVVKNRHVATPCKPVQKAGGDVGQHRRTGGVSPWNCGTAIKAPCEEPEPTRTKELEHTLSPHRRSIQTLSNEMFEGFEDIAREDLAEWIADFNQLGEGSVQRSPTGKGCSRSSPDGHVASNVLWDTCGRNSVSSSVASTCLPASCQSLSDERGSGGHGSAVRCNLDLFVLAEHVNDVSYP